MKYPFLRIYLELERIKKACKEDIRVPPSIDYSVDDLEHFVLSKCMSERETWLLFKIWKRREWYGDEP